MRDIADLRHILSSSIDCTDDVLPPDKRRKGDAGDEGEEVEEIKGGQPGRRSRRFEKRTRAESAKQKHLALTAAMIYSVVATSEEVYPIVCSHARARKAHPQT